jgi:hypothetical protein
MFGRAKEPQRGHRGNEFSSSDVFSFTSG